MTNILDLFIFLKKNNMITLDLVNPISLTGPIT